MRSVYSKARALSYLLVGARLWGRCVFEANPLGPVHRSLSALQCVSLPRVLTHALEACRSSRVPVVPNA